MTVLSPERKDVGGAALLLALVTAALVTAIATTMALTSSTDLLITGSNRASLEAMYAAEAAAQRAIAELAQMGDWSDALLAPPANTVASFDDGVVATLAPDGRRLVMAALSTSRQAMSSIAYGPSVFGADSPAWRLFGHATLRALVPAGMATAPAYVLVWVADDRFDGDGDAAHDANGRLLVRAEAYGVSGAHRNVELTVDRVTPGTIRVLSTKDPR
jgi:hypothetical protein